MMMSSKNVSFKPSSLYIHLVNDWSVLAPTSTWECPHPLTFRDTQHVCMKAKKMIGLLYRNYYQHLPDTMLLQLYKSLVRPHLEYAAAIWSPSSQNVEKVQKFALRMVTKYWDLSYMDKTSGLSVLRNVERWLDFDSCIYKILNS